MQFTEVNDLKLKKYADLSDTFWSQNVGFNFYKVVVN